MDQQRMEARRQKKRESMLDAAMAILIEHGSDGLTIAALAKSLSLSVGALYRYFDGKETIMVELQKRAIRRFHERLTEDIEGLQQLAHSSKWSDNLALLMQMLALFHGYGRDAVRAPEEHALMRTIMNAPNQLLSVAMAMEVDQTIQPVLQIGVNFFRDAQEQGLLSPGDPLMRTYIIWALMQGTDGFAKRDRFQPEAYYSPKITRAAYETVLLGWQCDPKLIAQAYEAFEQWTKG